MDSTISKKTLFNASCIALIVTAMTFAIRAGILVELGNDFNLNNTQLGWINSMAFWGFPVATIFGGLLDICVVPPKPVTLQNKSYNGTAAYDNPNIKIKIPANIKGVKFFFCIISIYQILLYYIM